MHTRLPFFANPVTIRVSLTMFSFKSNLTLSILSPILNWFLYPSPKITGTYELSLNSPSDKSIPILFI